MAARPTAAAPASIPPGAIFVPTAGSASTTITSAAAPNRQPGGDAAAAPNLLVLLHGAGDTPAPFARLAAKLALPNTASLALRAPFRLGPDGWTWFEEGEDEACDAASLEAARPALAASIDAAGWPRHRVHLFGYGEGGAAVLDLVLAAANGGLGPGPAGSGAGGRRWGSAVTVGAALLPGALRRLAGRQQAGAAAAPSHPTTPVLLTRGEWDGVGAPAPAAAATVGALRAAGLADACLHTVPGKGGGMLGPDREEVEAVMKHWARCLAAPVPAGCVEASEVG